MNRLRNRFILAFVGVMVLTVLVPIVIAVTVALIGGFGPPPGSDQIFAELSAGQVERLSALFLQFIGRQLLTFIGFGVLLGTLMSIWLSQTLAAPLHKLADAARAIGARDLSKRVEVGGSEEIISVGNAFNDMAAQLEGAEAQRRALLADVAHELRTPVTVIQGNLRAILDDVYPLEKEEVARLYDQTRHLGRLIEDLHELAQAEAHQLSLNLMKVNLPNLIKDTAAAFKPLAAPKQVEIRVELLGHEPSLVADEARLKQCLNNLIDNAVRHSPPGETVTIQSEKVDNRLEIRVIDRGEGMTADSLAHVFDRFYRVDKSRSRHSGGTGLGLAIVKAIVEMHQGQATAVSPGIGQGTTFTISLPLG